MSRTVERNQSKKDEPESTLTEKQQHTTLEIETKNGKLLVKTTVSDSKLQEVVIEKPKNDGTLTATTAPPGLVSPGAMETGMGAAAAASAATSSNSESKVLLTEADLKEQLAEKNRQLAKKRIRVDFSRSSLERNFITPVRAMSDFLLKPSDLETLPKTKRRSPYEQEPAITVYWRKDVEAKAIDVWGTRENLLKECLKREIEKKMHQQSKPRV